MKAAFDTHKEAIENLILANQIFRETLLSGHKYQYDPVFYAINFCTIRCDIGRQTGKPHIIWDLVKKPETTVIVKDQQCKDYYPDDLMHKVFTVGDILSDLVATNSYKTVFIDDAEIIFKDPETKQNLYEKLTVNEEITFVLLG